MDKYTIYCTKEQTRKALELGAPIESEFEYQFLANQEHGYYKGGTFQSLVECMGENATIFGNEPNRAACVIPTAEQMLGWLDEQGLKISLLYDYEYHGKWDYDSDYKGKQMPCTSMGEFDTRKSATLDAIDEALKFLETHKQ